MLVRPNIFTYFQILDYWTESIQYILESENSSFRKLVPKLGLSAPNAIQRISSGERPLKEEAWDLLGSLLSWNNDEKKYAQLLWKLSQTTSPLAQDKLILEMQEFRNKHQIYILQDSQYHFFRNWYTPVIWELCVHPQCTGMEWISQNIKPKVDIRKIRKTIEVLKELEMIEMSSEGQWVRKSAVISTPRNVKGPAIFAYHSDILNLAEGSMENWSSGDRDLRSVMIGLSEKKLILLKEKLADVWEEILNFSDESEDVEKICQVSFQMYPYTPHHLMKK